MKKLLLTLAMVSLMAGVATADILWDQSNYDPNWSGVWNSQSGCAIDWNGSTNFSANDVQFATDVTIESITVYYDMLDAGPSGATQAYLWIAPKAGNLPTDGVDNPLAQGTLVSVVASDDTGSGGNAWTITASGLNVVLTPGDYWVALTPIFPGGFWGPSLNILSLDLWGDPTATWETCAQFNNETWYNVSPDIEASILIEGTINVVATEDQTWGGMKALYR